MTQLDSFENGFFQFYESFEQVPSKNYNDSKPPTQNQSTQCFLCNKPFTFFHSAKICNSCKLQCCSDCIRKLDNVETCSCCYAIQTNQKNYDNLKTLHDYFNKFLKANNSNFTPQQTAILLFLNLLKRDEKYIHERIILALYKKRKFYIQDSKITPCIQENLFRFMEISKDNQFLPILVNLMCDISLYNKMCLPTLRPDYDFYRNFLNPKRPELSAAVSRLILILASNHLLNPDQDASMKLIAEGCREAVAYITASLATLFSAPSLYEDSVIPSSATECIFVLANLHDLVKNTLILFDQKKSNNSSLAGQYFASLILLKVSESDKGLNELTKHIPMKPLIDTAIRLCPRTLGLKKQEGRIAIYLSRMIKNVWLYCEKSSNRDDLLTKFFADISNFVFDVTEHKPGFERYSYLCTIQTIAIELADDMMEQEKYRSVLMNPQFQEKLKQMKEERRTALENEQLQKIDFLNDKTNQMEQLTQDQILQIREREKENKKIREQLQ